MGELAIMSPFNSNVRNAPGNVNVNLLKYDNEMLDEKMSQFLGSGTLNESAVVRRRCQFKVEKLKLNSLI